jgi:hypothetical protein
MWSCSGSRLVGTFLLGVKGNAVERSCRKLTAWSMPPLFDPINNDYHHLTLISGDCLPYSRSNKRYAKLARTNRKRPLTLISRRRTAAIPDKRSPSIPGTYDFLSVNLIRPARTPAYGDGNHIFPFPSSRRNTKTYQNRSQGERSVK